MRIAHFALLAPALCLAQAQPKLRLDVNVHDFGRISPDANVTHLFKLTNAGDATLEILRIHPTCGCTTAVMGKKSLAPGESTDLAVGFLATGLRGKVHKDVEIVTNDPAPVQTLAVEADVMTYVVADTDEVVFRDLVAKDRRKASVKVASQTKNPVVVTDVELSEAPWLGVRTRTVGRDVFVDFDLLARSLPPGEPSGIDTVTLHVMNPTASVVNLRVRWERRNLFQVEPPRVVWSGPAGQELTAFVLVTRRDGKPFRILGARSSEPDIRVASLDRTSSPSHRIPIVLAKDAKPGNREARILLSLDTPGQKELEVRAAAYLK